MLEPKTFEIASSQLPFLAFTTDMTASGTEVAAAVIVRATIIAGIPRIFETFSDELTRK